MSESTLSMVWSELQARIASFLGWGRGAIYGDTAWTGQQQFELDGITASGLRAFYFPVDPNGQSSYEWSFLRPVATLTFPANTQQVNLPDDWGAPEGPMTVLSAGSTSQPWRIAWRNEAQVRSMYSTLPSTSGPPQFVAEQPLKGTTQISGSRKQLLLFPIADQAYTLQVAYYINPDYLSANFPYAYGGAQHTETILESCLAVAEKRLDDSATVHAAEFERRLQASISMDRRNKAQQLGPNLDQSDNQRILDRSGVHWYAPAATYAGQSFQ